MSALKTIAERAAERNLPFLVIGGHAVTAHGYPRKTFDLDIVVRRSDSNKWRELVSELGYLFHHESPAFLQFNHADLETQPLDIMLSNDETFTKLQEGSQPAPPSGGGAKIVALLPLIALKCHVVKNSHGRRVAKDMEDVIGLIEANKLDLKNDEVRAIFLKYGTIEFYDQVRKICEKPNP